jgi:hypothetical protein
MNHLKLAITVALLFMFSMMIPSVAHAELLTVEKWSFDFKNISILDAFKELQKQTGIEIVVLNKTTQPIMITYHNNNQSVIQVHDDLLRNVNHASSINYSDDGELKSINIIIIGQGDGSVNIPGPTSSNQTYRTTEEQKDLKSNIVKSLSVPISGTTGERINEKNKLTKPPEPPKIRGLESPPMPPPVFK